MNMNKTKIAGLFLTALLINTSSMAFTLSLRGETNQFHCTAAMPSSGDTSIPTVKIDTHNELVRGLHEGDNNIGGGPALGTVPSPGHLASLPISWKETDGTVRTLSDLCFDVKVDGHEAFGKPKDGSVTADPQTGSTNVSCEQGCANTKVAFGTGGYY